MQLTCTQEKVTANNKSIITWVLSSVGGVSKFYSTGPTNIVINGTNVYHKARVNWDTVEFPAAKGSVSGTIEVAHNENGSKSISVSMETAVYYSSTKEYKGTWELDTIARGVSILTAPSSFKDTTLPTVTYANPMGSNVKTLEMCIKDASGWAVVAPYRAVNKTGTLSYTFKDSDIEILRAMTAGGLNCGGIFVIRATTADGAEYTDKRNFTFTITESSATKPKVTMTIAISNPNTFPSALASTYVQGKSGVKATITGTGKYGGSISSYALSVGGVNKTSSSNVVTSEAIKSSGNVSVIGSAVDSRGFTGTASTTISVLEYSKPLVIPRGSDTAIQCYRSDGNGKRMGNSTSVWIKAKRSYHSLNGNNKCKLQWRRRLASDEWNDSSHTWADLVARTTTSTDEYNGLVSGTFELNKAYAIQIRAIDDIGEYDRKEFDVPTQNVALHLGKGGKNVSIGEYCDYAEDYTFRSSWKAIFEEGMLGRILPESAHGDIVEYAESCERGLTLFLTVDDTTNLPGASGAYEYSSGFVLRRTATQATLVVINKYKGSLAIKSCFDGEWSGWYFINASTTET